MRHDFFGANIQMLHLVEHGIKNDMLRSGTHDLLDFFSALLAATPDGNFRTEIRVFVTSRKPFTQPALRPRLVVIDGEINALGDAKRCRISLGFIKKAPDHRRLADESRRGGGARAHPTVAVLDRSP